MNSYTVVGGVISGMFEAPCKDNHIGVWRSGATNMANIKWFMKWINIVTAPGGRRGREWGMGGGEGNYNHLHEHFISYMQVNIYHAVLVCHFNWNYMSYSLPKGFPPLLIIYLCCNICRHITNKSGIPWHCWSPLAVLYCPTFPLQYYSATTIPSWELCMSTTWPLVNQCRTYYLFIHI